MGEDFKAIDQVKSTLIDLAFKFGPKVLVALAFVVIGLFVGVWVGRLADRWLRKLRIEIPVRELLIRIVRVLVVGLFVLMAVQNLGVELLPLLAGLGVAGAGVALAMQGVLGNLVAGLTVIFTNPFRIGEYISIAGEEGQVVGISLFNTVLAHPDLSRIVIPNRKIVGETLHNYGNIRQIEANVAVALDADLNATLSALTSVLRDNPLTLQDPAPVIVVNAITPTAIEVAAKPWVSVGDYVLAGSEVRKAIIAKLRTQNIAAPVPRQEVRLLDGPTR
jgi:small conductance mechanosensitive channel